MPCSQRTAAPEGNGLPQLSTSEALESGTGARRPTTVIIPPGARDVSVQFDGTGREEFRQRHGLEGKLAVMFSGNHSPCHPLDTLLRAAVLLRNDPEVAFCFIGGGTLFPEVRRFADSEQLPNILTLPYQPMEKLSASLSAADLQVVVMGDRYVGIVHPSKIYNILALAIPVLSIGPDDSPINDLAPPEANGEWFFSARHGEVEKVVNHIATVRINRKLGHAGQLAVSEQFRQSVLLDQLCASILGEESAEKAAQ